MRPVASGVAVGATVGAGVSPGAGVGVGEGAMATSEGSGWKISASAWRNATGKRARYP